MSDDKKSFQIPPPPESSNQAESRAPAFGPGVAKRRVEVCEVSQNKQSLLKKDLPFINYSEHNALFRAEIAKLEEGKSTVAASFNKKREEMPVVFDFPGIKVKANTIEAEIKVAANADQLAAARAKIESLQATAEALSAKHTKATKLKERILALPQEYQPEGILVKVNILIEEIEKSDGTNSEAFNARIAEINTEVSAKENEYKEKDIQQEKAVPPATSEEKMPTVDKLLDLANNIEEGPLKNIITTIAAVFTTIAVTLINWPWIGSKVRGEFISNELLDAKGDPLAKLALKVEREFRSFGLTRQWANQFGGKKTSDIVKMLGNDTKLAELTTDPKKLAALKQLHTELVRKGGDKSDAVVFEFIGNNPNWTNINYSSMPKVQPVTETAKNPLPTAPAVPQPTPDQTVKTPAPPTAPASNS